ncbi:hypothetical protein N8I77_011760 [Diaporthe amygdali]|uniref:Uncharacterized protein n=1 Tax=Phomopsis amygdali TaxID=1214568 RepID=A0AAD9S3B9_PHOAM|nr:hypothetical protein N8I77_011760 [Diaporthe amygdali]
MGSEEFGKYHGGIAERFHRFFRGITFQAIILGLVSFTQPGIWVALNNLGAGGQASPYVVNAANVVTFAIMVVFAPFCAVFGNRYSLKWVLVFGTIGYVPYCAALYTNTVYGTQWFLIFGAATCGFSAAALWTAEGAIAVGYPEASRRGWCVAIWLALNKIGSLIASCIQLALNTSNDQAGSISPKTYLVLVGLTCAGLPLSLLLSSPEKLIRRDGTKPTARSNKTTFKQGFRDFWAVCKTKHIYMLVPIFVTAQWGQTYNGNYLAAYFSVRGRTLAGFIVTIVGIIVNFVVGWFLDSKHLRRSTRSRVMWIVIAVIYIAGWIYQFINQADYQKEDTVFDWSSPGYARGLCAYLLYRVGYEAVGTWMYWLLGTYDTHFDTLALTSALLRSGESLGSTFSYAVGASKSASLMTNLIVAAVVWFASAPMATWSAWKVTDSQEEETLAVEDSATTSINEEHFDGKAFDSSPNAVPHV